MATAVTINPMELNTVNITIVGTAPLIIHAWSEKAKRMMLDKQMGKAQKKQHDVKIPVNDFMNSLYWLTERPADGKDDDEAERNFLNAVESGAKFGFPVSGIKQSAAAGAYRAGLTKNMVDMLGTFYITGGTDASTSDIAEIVGPTPIMREDMVKLAGPSRVADIRHRGQFDKWEIPLQLTYNRNGKYSLEQILNCFNVGGFMVGIGEWRPEKKGQFGMYTLKV